jgi:hypothetical protein
VGEPARAEGDFAGTDLKLVVAHLDDVFSLEDVPQLVLVLMNMEWGVKGIDLFNDGERPSGRIGGSSDDKFGIAELDAFSAICFDFVAVSLSHRAQM